MRVRGKILQTHPEPNHDVEVLYGRVAERRLEVAAVNDPVRRAVSLHRAGAKRNARDFAAAATAEHAYRRRRHHVRL